MDAPTEELGSAGEAILVGSTFDACVTPNPNLGEYLSSGPGGIIGEWGASIDAMPASSLKTDLQSRLLTALEGPSTAYPLAADRTVFLRALRAPLPMSLPFATSMPGNEPGLGQGWMYNSGGSHRGLDFSRSSSAGFPDPSFEVRAVADGKVIGVYFDGPGGGGGNTVVVEHTGRNGKKIYSFYMHMRNGRAHDLAAIQGIDCTKFSGNPASVQSCNWYKLSASKSPPAAFWGTDADAIVVTPGQNVTRGQKLGMSGNTMTGIGHIDMYGNPTSTDVNNHLHVYIGAPTTEDPQTAVEVDAYGVYQEASTGCYTGLDNPTYYPRLFAPYMPDFFDLGFGLFTDYPEYLTGMSYRPITLSFYDKSGAFDVAGSYQYSTDTSFLVKAGDDGTGIDDYDGVNKSWVPRETRVRVSGAGTASYDAILALRQAGEQTAYWHHLTQAQLDSVYQTYVVSGGYAIGDFFAYRQAGVQYYAVLFTTSASSSNWLTYGRSAAQALTDISSLPSGLQVAQVVADTSFSPPKFSMLARPATGCTPHRYVDQSTSIYQAKLDAETALGYALQRVQVYANGTKFNAVFHRSPTWLGTGCAAQP